MWIVPPSLESHFAPESACSTKASSLPSPEPALRVSLSGKVTHRPASWPGWKRRAWSQRLFGAIRSNPSLPSNLLGALTGLPPDFPANRTALPESAKALRTSVGSGTPSQTSFAELGRDSSFWKTCGDSFLPLEERPSERFSGIWPASGSMCNGQCYALPRWVPPTSEPGSSSWPTARANDSEKRGAITANQRAGLPGVAQLWPTPLAHDVTERGSGQVPGVKGGCACLARDARLWPTAKASDGNKGSPNQAGSRGDPMLPGAAAHWQTPAADSFRGRGADRKSEMGLDRQARSLWASPKASPGGPDATSDTHKGAPNLKAQTASWPTPAARDAKGANSEAHVTTTGSGRMHMDQLPNFVAHSFLRPVHSQNTGEALSPTRRTLHRRLNPAFVCWLMAWPIWWTRAEPMPFAAQAMEWWRCKLRQHLASLLNASAL